MKNKLANNKQGDAIDDSLRSEQSLEDYDRAIQLNPKDPVAYYNRGLAYGHLQRYEQAIEDFDRAIELDPEDLRAYANRGSSYGQLGMHELAISDFDRVIELGPEDQWAYNNRGNSYSHLGNYKQAVINFDRAIQLNPKFDDAYSNQGNIYSDLQKHEKAIEDYDRAIQLNPKDYNAYNNRGTTYGHLQRYEKAIEDFDRAIELNSVDPVAYNNRGLAYHGLQMHEKAIEDFDRAIELNLRYHKAYYNRGLAYHKLQMHEKAIEDYDRAIQLNLKYDDAYNNRGLAYHKLQMHEKAIEDFDRAIELNPRHHKAYYNRGLAYSDLQKGMNFTLKRNADIKDTLKQGVLDGISAAKMQQVFGDSCETDGDYLEGYSGNEWWFISDDGQVVTVYERHGKLHVGARSKDHFEPFVDWIMETLSESKKTDRASVEKFIKESNWKAIENIGNKAASPLMDAYDSGDYGYIEKKNIVKALGKIREKGVAEFLIDKYNEIKNEDDPNQLQDKNNQADKKDLTRMIDAVICLLRDLAKEAALNELLKGNYQHPFVDAVGIRGNCPTIDILQELVFGPDKKVALWALESLGRINDERSKKTLLKIIKDKKHYNPHWRNTAADALGRNLFKDKDPKIADAFLALIKSGPYMGKYSLEVELRESQEDIAFEEAGVINSALSGLKRIGDERVIEPAIALFNVPHCFAQNIVEKFAVKEVYRPEGQSPNFCPDLVQEKLLKHLEDQDLEIREVCAEILNKMEGTNKYSGNVGGFQLPWTQSARIRNFLEEEDWSSLVREGIPGLEALVLAYNKIRQAGAIGPYLIPMLMAINSLYSYDDMVKLLSSSSPHERMVAAGVLGITCGRGLQLDKEMEALKKALKDEDENVRSVAEWAINTINSSNQ